MRAALALAALAAAFPAQAADTPHPRSDTFLPKSAPPPERILAVPLAGLKPDERVALTCLQGLVAREQPRLWLARNAEDPFWMEWHRSRGYLKEFETVTNWPALFRQFGAPVRGAVIPDPALFRGDLLALNVAACEDLIVCSPPLAERLGLPVRQDLRGRFKTYAEGLEWVWTTYRDRYGKDGFLREVREQVGARRPAFVNGFVHCWTFTMDDLARIHAQRDPDMVFVTPSQLARLYREASRQ
jgi:hypothetical protein